MRQFLIRALILLGIVSQLAACTPIVKQPQSSVNLVDSPKEEAGIFKIICSSYPVYEWTKAIVGDLPGIEIDLLMDNGIDPHNYQASARDIIQIQTSDVCIYIGGTSEQWIDEVVADAPSVKTIHLMHELEAYLVEEEYIEGMTHGHEHEGHEHEGHTHDLHTHEGHAHTLADEHIWLSPQLAKEACRVITHYLSQYNKESTSIYEQNLLSYSAALDTLDEAYTLAVDEAAHNILIFGDRFPFRYLVDDYDIDYYAAFSGCSTDTEASFETITFLTEKLNETPANTVVYISSNNKELATTIINESTDPTQEIIKLNSMESITTSDIENGVSYISIMEDNLEALKTALE